MANDDADTITRADGAASTAKPPARVLLVLGGGEPYAVTLPDRPELTIGRGAQADVRIDESTLSRVHARLSFGMHVTIDDLGSSNGTFVGGLRLSPGKPVVLAPGVPLRLGSVVAMLHAGVAAMPTVVGSTDGSVAGARALDQVIERIAGTDLSVLLVGEAGVGKRKLARRLHEASRRSGAPFVVVGPSAGAEGVREGLARAGDGSVVFNEMTELDEFAQRVLVDGLDALAAPPRVFATTSRDPKQLLPELRQRLDGVSIVVPPLRARVHEIEALTLAIATAAAHAAGRPPPVFAPDALALLERHRWPGNVRELEARVTKAVALARGRVLTATHFADLETEMDNPQPRGGALREAREQGEYQRIIEALRTSRGNQTRAAQALGISRSTLLARLEKYGVPRPRKS